MIKRHLFLLSLFWSQLCLKAQISVDSAVSPQKRTEIELVYNHYLQDGNNSAVTGGVGTEKLTVYGPSATLRKFRGSNVLEAHLGVDIISSASTDKIDYVVSSASSRDARYIAEVGHQRSISSKWSINGGLAYSLESDYFSQGYKLGVRRTKNDLNSLAVQLQYYNDDLRWGRINPSYFRPEKLIYPSELRYKEWFDSPKRNSFNLKVGWTFQGGRQNVVGIYPEFSYQGGLLATPFHRVYFTDNSLRVENLPSRRFRTALAFKVNTALSDLIIIKNSINGYSDDFGIRSLSFENESVFRVNPFLLLMPGFRIMTQKASTYFAPFQQHLVRAEYYTSDYDLSGFETYTLSLGMKYHPFDFIGRRILFNTMIFRYSYLFRTNGLKSHVMSAVFTMEYFKNKK